MKPTILVFIYMFLNWQFAYGANYDTWQAPYYQANPNLGKVWNVKDQVWEDKAGFLTRLVNYQFILLGEQHDNPDHHRLQAEVLEYLARQNDKPALIMEMLNREAWQNQSLTWSNTQQLLNTASRLNPGWPWQQYRPILDVVTRHRLALFAANVSYKRNKQASPNEKKLHDVDQENMRYLNQKQLADLKQAIQLSHCGMVPADRLDKMLRVQVNRDYQFSKVLIDAAGRNKAVLIAGAQHVHKNYGVPVYLQKNTTPSLIASVLFLPVTSNVALTNAERKALEAGYDFLFITPNTTQQDPCKEYKDKLQKLSN